MDAAEAIEGLREEKIGDGGEGWERKK